MQRPTDRPELDTLARNVLLIADVRPVVSSLRRGGCAPVALKGLALLGSVYRLDLGVRPMADADLLIAPEHRERAERVLEEHGFERVPGHQSTFRGGRGAPPTRIDLHCEVWYLGAAGTRALISRAAPIVDDLGGAAVPALEDHLLLVATHATVLHGQLRTVWCEDLRRLVEAGPDWDRLERSARENGLAVPLHAALRRVREAGGAVPGPVLSRLAPRGTDRLRSILLERVLSRPETPEAGHLLRFVFRRGLRQKWRAARRQLFPGTEFLRRRYGVESTRAVARRGVLRPAETIGRTFRLAARLGGRTPARNGGAR